MTLSESGNFDDIHHPINTGSIHDFDVYNGKNERIGKVIEARTDGVGNSSYLLIKVGSWLANRQVLLPLRSYRVNLKDRRIDVDGWSKEEINHLPVYPIEAQVEDPYAPLETSASVESVVALEEPITRKLSVSTVPVEAISLSQKTPMSDASANKNLNSSEAAAEIIDEEVIPLLAERLIIDRHKRKSGEIVIRKVIETEVIEVLVRREKLIVEQVSPEYKELAVIDLGRTSVEDTSSS